MVPPLLCRQSTTFCVACLQLLARTAGVSKFTLSEVSFRYASGRSRARHAFGDCTIRTARRAKDSGCNRSCSEQFRPQRVDAGFDPRAYVVANTPRIPKG